MRIGKINSIIRLLLRNDLVFVSHPYSDNPAGNKMKVDNICKELFDQGEIPLSPIHLFSFMSDDRHRNAIMLMCKLMIAISSKCYFYEYDALSDGQKEELNFATKMGKTTIVK